jgi:hypothetical protein
MTGLDLTRQQVLAFRRRAGALDERLPAGQESLRYAAWAGLQDSVPRAAVTSIHARVEETGPTSWEDPSLVQVWGPRFSTYVIAAEDRAVFTLGRLPDDAAARRRAEETATRLHELLAGRTMTYAEAGRAMGVHPTMFRYAAPTGTVLIRWEGAGRPTVWTVPRPDVDPAEAGLELARRFLRVLGPATAEAFAEWAGIAPRQARTVFESLGPVLTPVRSPIGAAWILAEDEAGFRSAAGSGAPARLLPSGDVYFLLWGADRQVLVPEADRARELWTSRVWPGAVLVDGEIAGIWRRAGRTLSVRTWRRLSRAARDAVETEASSLPVPGQGRIAVQWEG